MKRSFRPLIALWALLLLPGVAQCACTGFIMAWCNWQTDEVEVWQYPCLQLPFHLIVSLKKLSFFGLEIDIGLGPYTLIPNDLSLPDFDKGKKIGTIPAKCKYLKDLNLGHPNQMGSPIANKIISMTNAPQRAATANANIAVAAEAFPYFQPGPAVLPPNFPMPTNVTSGACDGSLSVYQVQNESNTVAHVRMCPTQFIKSFNVCNSPLQLAVTPDGATVLVTCYNNQIAWIDTATDTLSGTLQTTIYPSGIAISPDGTKAYVTNFFDIEPSLVVIDVARRAVLSTIPLRTAYPGTVALTPDGSQAWVNYYQSSIVDIVDLQTGTTASRLNLGEVTQNGIAFNATGSRAFIASGANHLSVVDTSTLQVVSRINVVDAPLDVLPSPDGSRVFVSSYSRGEISVVDPTRNRVVQTITTGGAMQGLNLVLGSVPVP